MMLKEVNVHIQKEVWAGEGQVGSNYLIPGYKVYFGVMKTFWN